jgi:copper chaperone CopZ
MTPAVQLHVEGMLCMENCGRNVERALGAVTGVRTAAVDFPQKVATVVPLDGVEYESLVSGHGLQHLAVTSYACRRLAQATAWDLRFCSFVQVVKLLQAVEAAGYEATLFESEDLEAGEPLPPSLDTSGSFMSILLKVDGMTWWVSLPACENRDTRRRPHSWAWSCQQIVRGDRRACTLESLRRDRGDRGPQVRHGDGAVRGYARARPPRCREGGRL